MLSIYLDIFVAGISMATTVLVSQYAGAENEKMIQKNHHQLLSSTKNDSHDGIHYWHNI
ncbi:MAG: hypothetical protein JJT76_09115 [Clostridiaceae bacterium]|nr:hypothetical protein [Clostridiaceae bacterium]